MFVQVFPYGGLQRDFLRVALTVAARGHHVRVFTQSWQGERPEGLEIILVPVTARTNHGKNEQYYQWVQNYLSQHPVDRIVGFNKMHGLDVYYAADVCYAEKVAREKGFFYKLTRRYRHYSAFEKATFQQGSGTTLLMLTDKQIGDFKQHYHTESQRFRILPPVSTQTENTACNLKTAGRLSEKRMVLLSISSCFCRSALISNAKVCQEAYRRWLLYLRLYVTVLS